MTTIEIVLAILGSNVATLLITQWLNRKKTQQEANHIAVDVANDALTMIRQSADYRVALLEKQVKDLTEALATLQVERVKERETYDRDIRDLSKRLSDALAVIETLRKRIDELVETLKRAGEKLPEWAQG